MYPTDCRHFTGYKPCSLNAECSDKCPHLDRPSHRLLIIHLGALGAVLRSSALLAPIRRAFGNPHITWLTQAPAHELFKHETWIDRLLTTDPRDLRVLEALEFDIAFVIDKALEASGLLQRTRLREIRGFRADPRTGAILPANSSADYLWTLGLNNREKFFENQKPETQLVAEALELPYQRDPYRLVLTGPEKSEALQRRQSWLGESSWILGINTGASATLPAKKLSVEGHRVLIHQLQARFPKVSIVLLGGGDEDRERNRQIGQGLNVHLSSCDRGLRDGLMSMAACDLLVTGDSLGMHMGIALEKWVVAWFGPTCAHEIDLFDRGVAVRSQVACSPCWKRSCSKEVMCYDRVDFDQIASGVAQGLQWKQKISLSRLPSLETFSSLSL